MSTLAPLPGYGVTKGSIVETAFEYCGLAGYEFERTPEEMASGVRQLALMMMDMPTVPYNFVDYGFGLPEEGSNLENKDVSGVTFMLALRLATLFGKTLPPEFFVMANPSIYAFKARYAVIPQQDYRDGTIRGAGARLWRGPFFPSQLEEDDTVVDPGNLAALAGE